MKVQTSELSGIQLDYAVAICLGGIDFHYDTVATYWITIDGKDRALSKSWAQAFAPSTDWSHGGPIIEGERILIQPEIGKEGCGNAWSAISMRDTEAYGPTALIAAMRCYVASKSGDEVEIPAGLL
jgi:hypothetical protein